MLRTLPIAAILTLCCIGPTQADYANGEFAMLPSEDSWSAVGNGVTWGSISPDGDLNAKARVVADSGASGRITEVHAWIDLYSSVGDKLSGQDFGYHKLYDKGKKKNIDSTVPVQIPEFQLQTWLIEQCHEYRNQLRDQGLADNEIWASDREIDLNIGLEIAVGFSGPDWSWFPKPDLVGPVSWREAKLTCLKYTPSETPSTGGVTVLPCPEEKVVNSKLLVNGIASLGGTCTLALDYAIYTSCPSMEVKFKLRAHRWGDLDPETGEEEWVESNVITTMSNDWKLAVGTLQYDLTNEVGAEKGKLQMVGVSPPFGPDPDDDSFDFTPYTMVCHEPGTGPIGLTGGTPQTPPKTPSFGVRIDDGSAVSYESLDKN